MTLRASSLALVLLAVGACRSEPPLTPPPPLAPPLPAGGSSVVGTFADPLGPKPELAAPKPFAPPSPEIFTLANGLIVWLVPRHSLPMVSVTLAVPAGSAADPPEAPGLAHITADMLDEGAGSRNAVELSSAVNDLGATLGLGATSDGSFVSLSVLKKNFTPAFGLLADVVVRPRFDLAEWKRVHSLWENDLIKREDDPSAVSRVVADAAVFGAGTPYGHPSDGLRAGAARTDLSLVKSFYAAHWRPDGAVLVVTGDITKDELTSIATPALAEWKKVSSPPPSPAAKLTAQPPTPKLILVDRRDAPQSVIAVVRGGVAASDPSAPLLSLVNTALGGSFTSRLNQDLREDHGWTYGARSSFTETRNPGMFVAKAAVRTDATGVALKAMLEDIRKMAEAGLDAGELAKVQAHDRADLVQGYETTSGMAHRLGTLALLGLPPSFDATASLACQRATLPVLAALARQRIDPKEATIVVVGPRAEVEPQLAAIGLTSPALWSTQGKPLPNTAKPPPPTPAKKH